MRHMNQTTLAIANSNIH